jgi:electron-transferring-flavoprotein dehydrogenase
MELRGKYVFRRRRARQPRQGGDREIRPVRGHEPQKFGLGMKEIWEIDPAKHREGTVTHTMGWPLGKNAGGGSFIYHLENNQVYVGFVVHLNYANPYLYPYMEFQRFKHHPMVAELLEGRQARGLRRPRHQRGRLAVDPETDRARRALLGCSAGW